MRNDSAAPAAAADGAFGADMYQVLAEDAADTVFSPASVASALRMALCGAHGKTAAELARALHLDGADRQEDVAVSGLRLVSALGGGGRDSGSDAARRGRTSGRIDNTSGRPELQPSRRREPDANRRT